MGRPNNPDLTKYWKICLPATLAGTVELYLMDTIHKKPQYGARAKLITELLEGWVQKQKRFSESGGSLDPEVVKVKAVTREIRGYEYMLAHTKLATGEYTGWQRHMSPVVPNVPAESIRGLQPLYVMNDQEHSNAGS